jgi:hypothetical protein
MRMPIVDVGVIACSGGYCALVLFTIVVVLELNERVTAISGADTSTVGRHNNMT